MRERLEEHKISVELTPAAIEFLITKGFHEDYGARPLRRAIERFIEDPLAEHLLRGKFEEQSKVWIDRAPEADEDAGLEFLDEAPIVREAMKAAHE